ncbi:MAG: hypothetical protein HRT77_07610 [Halioglobus sp.]|nr:hypothetical protein [Halioglobus sp.]
MSAPGRVHLYHITGGAITLEQTIVYGALGEQFGADVDLDAAHLLVDRPGTTPGAADLFDPDTGSHITTLHSPGTDDRFGESVTGQ